MPDTSQEVRDDLSDRNGARTFLCGVKDFELPLHIFVDVQNGGNITAAVAVVWSRPDCNQVWILEPVLEAVHDELMRTGNKLKIVDVVELGCDLRAEEPASASGPNNPSLEYVFRVRPHQVAEGSVMRNFHTAIDQIDLVQSLDLGWETAVDAKYLAFDYGTDTQVVEYLGTVLPWVDIAIFAHGLLIEAIDGWYSARFVVAAQKRDAVGVLELQAEEKLESLNWIVATVDEISHENVASVRDLTALFKKFEKIVELTVNISANGDWGTHRLNVALLDEDFFDFLAENAKISLR